MLLYFRSNILINHIIECLGGAKHSAINHQLVLVITLNLEIVAPENS